MLIKTAIITAAVAAGLITAGPADAAPELVERGVASVAFSAPTGTQQPVLADKKKKDKKKKSKKNSNSNVSNNVVQNNAQSCGNNIGSGVFAMNSSNIVNNSGGSVSCRQNNSVTINND